MKADNVFKFVSLRPPSTVTVRNPDNTGSGANPIPNPPSPSFPPAGNIPSPEPSGFLEGIRSRMTTGLSFDEARLAIANEFMDSENYVTRNLDWRKLLPFEDSLRTILQNAKVSQSVEELSQRLFSLIDSNVPSEFNRENLLRNDNYLRLRKALWSSYLSNVVINQRRMHDRISLLFWIRLFHLMENLTDGQLALTLLEKFEQLKPMVPVDLVWSRPRRPDELILPDRENLVKERVKKINEIKGAIRELKDFKSKLEKIFDEKILESSRPQANIQDSLSAPIVKCGESLPIEGSSAHILEDAEFRISRSELDSYTLKVLTKHEIDIDNASETRLIQDIEVLIAKKFKELHSLQRVQAFKIIRGVLVKVNKKIIDV